MIAPNRAKRREMKQGSRPLSAALPPPTEGGKADTLAAHLPPIITRREMELENYLGFVQLS